LLTAEQEREIDGRKWGAVGKLRVALADGDANRGFLMDWSANTTLTPLDIAYFDQRDLHFVLRREMAEYMSGGKKAKAMEALHTALQRKRTAGFIATKLDELELPASLTVGLATVVLRRSGDVIADTVGDALQDWARFWSPLTPRPTTALDSTTRDTIKQQIGIYSDARD
ncbi:unnamed protein product, partial [Ectocarpus sp. 12 AP-2014]